MKLLTLGSFVLATIGVITFACNTVKASEQHRSKSDELLSAEVAALRADVSQLRADIHRLIGLLQLSEGPTTISDYHKSGVVTAPSAPQQHTQQTVTSNPSAFVDLTLESCVEVALQNANLESSDLDRSNLIKRVHEAYWDLWYGYKSMGVYRDARDVSLDLWRLAADRTGTGDGNEPEAEAQARALYKQFESQITVSMYGSSMPGIDRLGLLGSEQKLRDVLGWPPGDGRMIRPIDKPNAEHVKLDFKRTLERVLQGNPALESKRLRIGQLEREHASVTAQHLPISEFQAVYRWLGVDADQIEGNSHTKSHATEDENLDLDAFLEITPNAVGKRRMITGLRNSHLQIVKLKEELRKDEMLLVDKLTRQWRRLESVAKSINDFGDQLQANRDEVGIYQAMIDQGEVEPQSTVDLLLRAEERRARSEDQYYAAIAEHCKMLVAIDWLQRPLGGEVAIPGHKQEASRSETKPQ